MLKRLRMIVIFCLILGLIAPNSGLVLAVENDPLPKPEKVVMVIMKNHSYSSIIGNPKAPYLNYLAQTGALFTKSYALDHPSQPNYLMLFSGATQGVKDNNCPYAFDAPNLASELLAKGHSFKGYSEDLPQVGAKDCQVKQYARKHNPWVSFTNVPDYMNQPLQAFPSDFRQLPSVSIIVPTLMNDSQQASIEQSDQWLERSIDAYVKWAMINNSLLIVTWDEGDELNNNQIPTIFVGPMVKAGITSEPIQHLNVLRTISDLYGITPPANSKNTPAIQSIWLDRNDQIEPSIPTNLQSNFRSDDQVSLSWTASTDNQRVVGYEIIRDGVTLGRTSTTQWTDVLVNSSSLPNYQVISIDHIGNRSMATQPYTLPAWPVDQSKVTTIYSQSDEYEWIHYSLDGKNWTTLPGFKFKPSAVNGYQVVSIWTGNATGIAQAAIHNAYNQWKNNNGQNYTLPNGTYTISTDGALRIGKPDFNGLLPNETAGPVSIPMITPEPTATVQPSPSILPSATPTISPLVEEPVSNEVSIYYATQTNSNFHYTLDGTKWTDLPGTALQSSNAEGYQMIKIKLNAPGNTLRGAFNDGKNNWDNNQAKDYTFVAGTFTVENGNIIPGAPKNAVSTPKPTPEVTPVASPKASADVTVIASPSLEPTATATPSPTPSPQSTPIPTESASIVPTATNTPTVTVVPEPTTLATATPALNGTQTVAEPSATPKANAQETYAITVYYKDAGKVRVMFRLNNGKWSKSPGVLINESEIKGFKKVKWTVLTKDATIEANFRTAKGIDDNKGKHYKLKPGVYQISKGKLIKIK